MPNHISDVTQYGLLLPNGQVLWDNYSNHPLGTPAEREMMVQVLRKTAEECGFTEDGFLSNYNWVSRRVKTEIADLGTFTLSDPAVIGVDTIPDSEDDVKHDDSNSASPNGAVGNDGIGGNLREGSVGGTPPRSA